MNSKKMALLIAVITILISSLGLVSPIAAQESTGAQGPVLSIPSISLTAPIVNAPLVPALGTWDVSHINFEVAHLEYTPRFGTSGNSVIAGHLRDGAGAPSIFINLPSVSVGDAIVITEGETTYGYTVTETRTVDPSDISVVRNTSSEIITLLTCYGSFSSATGTYTQRFVVIATRTS